MRCRRILSVIGRTASARMPRSSIPPDVAASAIAGHLSHWAGLAGRLQDAPLSSSRLSALTAEKRSQTPMQNRHLGRGIGGHWILRVAFDVRRLSKVVPQGKFMNKTLALMALLVCCGSASAQSYAPQPYNAYAPPASRYVQPQQSTEQVQGYTRANGTYVQPYVRTAPDNTRENNWSSKPNIDPYTGKEGTKNPYANPYGH